MKCAGRLAMMVAAIAWAGCASPSAAVTESPGAGAAPSNPFPPPAYARAIPPIREPAAGVPVVAIVIDDCGESVEQIAPFLGIPIPVSFSILPYHPGVADTVRTLHRHGREALVHMPMEPHDARWLENDWFLRTGMGDEDIRERLDRALGAVPTASGINNHMGSKFCAEQPLMATVMNVANENGMYYLDSRTTSGSTAAAAAADAGTPFIARDVFLDNNDDAGLITAQLEVLVETARKNGCAVGIGHARTRTAEAIMNFVRDRDHGVVFVPAGRLVGRCRPGPDDPSGQARIPPE